VITRERDGFGPLQSAHTYDVKACRSVDSVCLLRRLYEINAGVMLLPRM